MEIGINTMSAMNAMRADFEGTVKRLKAGGCDWLEAMSDWGAKQETIDFYSNLTGGPSGWDPENAELRMEIARKNGMSIKGLFIFDERLDEQAQKLGKYCQKNGISYVVLSFLEYGGIEDIYEKAALIRKAAAVLGNYGVQILMHNHEHDTMLIRDKDGTQKPIISIFLQQCLAQELMLEVDTGWLVYAGVDAPAYVRRHLDRIAVMHLKDICKDYKNVPREDIFVPCGQGAVDFPAIMAEAGKKADMMYVLDQDKSRGDIIEDHIASIKYLKSICI